MVRTVFVPKQKEITLPIPDNYIGLQLEMLLFPVEEPTAAALPQPLQNTRKKRTAGSLKGQIVIADDFDAPLDDFKDYM